MASALRREKKVGAAPIVGDIIELARWSGGAGVKLRFRASEKAAASRGAGGLRQSDDPLRRICASPVSSRNGTAVCSRLIRSRVNPRALVTCYDLFANSECSKFYAVGCDDDCVILPRLMDVNDNDTMNGNTLRAPAKHRDPFALNCG